MAGTKKDIPVQFKDISVVFENMDTSMFPAVRRRIADSNPPAEGEGIRLAIYQGPGLVGDEDAIEANLKILERAAFLATRYEGDRSQLLVLPELFLCGYNIWSDDVQNVGMEQSSPWLDRVGEFAKKYDIAIICPFAEKEVTAEGQSRYYDAMMLFGNTGERIRNYRKTQLWGNDEKTNWWYPYVDDPDDAYQVDKVNGVNVGMLNCYEAEFPELSRILATKGAQLVVVPTAADVGTMGANGQWSDWAYPDVSRTAVPINAYQNQMFVAYSNRALFEYRPDRTMTGVYLGNSAIGDPYGELLVNADNVFETVLIADCVPEDYAATHPDRQSDYLKDRRPRLYSQLTSTSITLPDGSTYEYPGDPNKKWHPS